MRSKCEADGRRPAPEFTSGVSRLLHYSECVQSDVADRRVNPRDKPGGESFNSPRCVVQRRENP